MPPVRPPFRTPPCVEPIEPRWLFSADPVPVAAGAELPTAVVQLVTPAAPVPADPPAPGSTAAAASTAGAPADALPPATDTQPAATEWVIIDSRVTDKQTLIADLQRQRDAGRDLQWIELGADEDGVARISELLAQSGEPVRALHLISHSQSGELELGASRVDLDTLRLRAPEFAGWAGALTAEADLLVYGCDLAAGPQGSELVDALATLTGADVAASTDATGHASLGGDWQLERQTGSVEAPVALSASAQQDWHGLLQLTPTATEAMVNSNNTGGKQNLPPESGGQQIASDGVHTVITWEDGNQIYARLTNEASNTNTIITVPSGGNNMQDPSVAMDSNGNFVVAWSWKNPDGNGLGIFAQRYTSAGVAIGSAIQVNTVNTANDQTLPAVTFLSNGDFAVSWTSDFGGQREVQMAVLDFSTAAFVLTEQTVNTTSASDQTSSSIAASGDGRIMVVWESKDQIGSGWSVIGRTFDNAGGTASAEVSLASYTSGQQIDPSVGGGDSQFVVSYAHDEGSGSQYAYARIFTTLGTAADAPVRVDESSGSDKASNTAISVAPDGSFIVAWWENADDVFVRDFNRFGIAATPAQIVMSTASGPQDHPTLDYDGSKVRIAWDGDGPGDNDGVFTRTFDVAMPQINLFGAANPTTTESGGTATIGVSLNSAPSGNVVVTLTSSNTREGQITAGSALTFTPGNYSSVQTVTLAGVDDPIDDGDRTWQVSISASSTDTNYSGNFGPPLDIVNRDDDSFSTITVDTTSTASNGVVASLWDLWNNRGSDGKISLREAIEASNNSANGIGGADRIRFDIAAMGSDTISLSGDLPAFSDVIDVDGRSSTLTTTPEIQLRNGFLAFTGLSVGSTAAGSSIRGLSMTGFLNTAVQVSGANTTVEFNWLGQRLDGSAVGNSFGLRVEASGALVRSNVIGSNGLDGVFLDNASGTRIESNFIGLSDNGSSARGNFGNGVQVRNSNGVLITGNTITASGTNGVTLVNVDGAVIQSNYIGTNALGGLVAGNARDGILIIDSSSGNLVGGTVGATSVTALNEGNRIVASGWAGIQVVDGTGPSVNNALVGNLIDGNGFGIDLAGAASAPSRVDNNDPGDADSGPNDLQNSPVLTSVLRTGPNSVQISGSLASAANTHFRVEFFLDTTVASGNGEGPTLVSVLDLTTDASGSASFLNNVTLPGPSNGWITATATRQNAAQTLQYSTSEFAVPAIINSPPTGANLTRTINESQTYTFTFTEFNNLFLDPDGNSLGGIRIDSLPGAGQGQVLLDSGSGPVPLVAGTTVAANDLTLGHLTYVPPAGLSGTAIGNFQFRVLDEFGLASSAAYTYQVDANPVDDPPVLATNTGLSVIEAGSVAIGTGQLQATDPDNPTSDLHYEVLTSAANGTLRVGGVAQTVGDIFTQAQVDAGLVQYQHNGSETSSDTIGLRLSSNGLTVPDFTLSVAVSPVDDPPVLTTNPGLSVNEAGSIAIGTSQLQASDPDNTANQLQYEVLTTAQHGTLRVGGVIQAVGDRFTQAQIDAGQVQYQHDGSETTSDAVGLRLSSNGLNAPDFQLDITVNPIDDPAVMVNNTGVTVSEGATATIGSAALRATDPDTPSSGLVYLLQAVPTNGSVLVGGLALAAGDTFTQAQVTAGLLQYRHDGSNTTSDVIQLSLSSGAHPAIAVNVALTISPIDNPPVLATNTGLSVIEAGSVAIGTGQLQATDPDNPTSDLHYEVLTSAANGTLRVGGVAQTVGDIFTQAQVDAGLVQYQHNGSETSSDTIGLRLSSNGLTVPDFTLGIGVIPADDPAVIVNNTGETLDEGALATLGNGLLLATDVDTPASALVYRIRTAPASGSLLVAGVAQSTGDTFTQAQVNVGEVQYRHDGSETTSDMAQLELNSGLNPTIGLTFNLTITPVDDPPALAQNNTIAAREGAVVAIMRSDLQVADADNSDGNLSFSVTRAPAHGAIELNGAALPVGAVFSQDDINLGLLSYRHDGGETTSDSFGLSLTSQTYVMTGIEVPIAVQSVNDPPRLSAPPLMLGSEDIPVQFTAASASAISVGDPDPGAVVDISLSVDAGTVTLSTTTGLNFTSGDGTGDGQMVFRGSIADVNAALTGLAYTAPSNTSGVFSLRVVATDPVDGSSDTRVVPLTVLPANDAPVLVNRVDLLLDQVRSALIENAHLLVTDIEDGPADIGYTILTLPPTLAVKLDGSTLAVGDRFTQAQIDNGQVSVQYLGRDSGQAELVLKASDRSNGSVGDLRLTVFAQLSPVSGSSSSSSSTSASTSSTASTSTASTAAVAAVVVPPDAGGSRDQRVFVPSGDDSNIRRNANAVAPDGKNSNPFRNVPSGARSAEALAQSSSVRETPTDSGRRRGFDGLPSSQLERRARADSGLSDTIRGGETAARYSELARSQRSAALREGLNELRGRIDERISLERNVVASSVAVTSSLSIGYVIWLLRGGVLLSSMLAAIPAWQSIDPLPVLSRFNDGKGGEDDDSLEEMLEKSKRADGAALKVSPNPDLPDDPDTPSLPQIAGIANSSPPPLTGSR